MCLCMSLRVVTCEYVYECARATRLVIRVILSESVNICDHYLRGKLRHHSETPCHDGCDEMIASVGITGCYPLFNKANQPTSSTVSFRKQHGIIHIRETGSFHRVSSARLSKSRCKIHRHITRGKSLQCFVSIK